MTKRVKTGKALINITLFSLIVGCAAHSKIDCLLPGCVTLPVPGGEPDDI